jgi:hypothetical protein
VERAVGGHGAEGERHGDVGDGQCQRREIGPVGETHRTQRVDDPDQEGERDDRDGAPADGDSGSECEQRGRCVQQPKVARACLAGDERTAAVARVVDAVDVRIGDVVDGRRRHVARC